MKAKKIVRLLPAAALLAALVPAPTPAAASWPGANGSIFVVTKETNETSLSRFDPAGGEPGSGGTGLAENSNVAVDPQGQRIAYAKLSGTQADIVMVDFETFDEVVVVSGPGDQLDPAFSFDGRYLLYASDADGDQEIYMKDLTNASAEPARLTENTFDDWAPAWGNAGTGHGDLVAFVSREDGDPDIYTMTPGGADKTNLTNNGVNDFGPNWHPDFDMLAYSSQDGSGRDQVFTMSFDGTGKDQLTSGEAFNYEPAWSPDGTKIAFTKQGTGIGDPGRIFVRSGSPGGTETALTPADSSNGFDRAEWQAEPGNCVPPECGGGDPVKPALFLSLARHLTVRGGVDGPADTTGGICGVGTPITIQRRAGGEWKNVARVTTNENGTFSKGVPDKTGKYRLRSAAFTDEANERECLASTSAAKTHRHS